MPSGPGQRGSAPWSGGVETVSLAAGRGSAPLEDLTQEVQAGAAPRTGDAVEAPVLAQLAAHPERDAAMADGADVAGQTAHPATSPETAFRAFSQALSAAARKASSAAASGL